MKLSLATAQDNQDLLQFYNSFSAKGHIETLNFRKSDFFSPYQIQNGSFKTYVLRDIEEQNKPVTGVATFVTKEVLHESKLMPVSFGYDLRIANSRKAVLSWSQYFMPTLYEILQESAHVFTCLNLTETAAINAFVRSRQIRRSLPRYHLFRKFYLSTVHGVLPFSPKPLNSIEVRQGKPSDWDALIQYLSVQRRSRAFTNHCNTLQTDLILSDRMGLRAEDFVIAFTKKGQIIGCMALWKDLEFREIRPLDYDLRGENFRQFLKLGRLLGWTHTLPTSFDEKNQTHFDFHFVLFLEAQNPDIFESMIHFAFGKIKKNEFLMYLRFEDQITFKLPRYWVSTDIPYGLYSVLPPEANVPDFLNPSYEGIPDLEPCFVY